MDLREFGQIARNKAPDRPKIRGESPERIGIMSQTHARTFRIRYCECDAYGHVNNANYVRFMQETAFDASAAVGYDAEHYAAIGHHWLTYETEVEFLMPLRYGDSVEVTTWVADFRHARSRRMYELKNTQSGELAARASTDWVFINTASGRPAPIPPKIAAAYLPEGEGESEPEAVRQRFPGLPMPPPDVFSLRRRVEWRDIDAEQHVNNAIYLNYLDDVAWQVSGAYGWPMSRLRDEGFAVIARRLHIQYRQPALLDDELEISTWLSDVKRVSAVRNFRIMRVADQEVLAQAYTLFVLVSTETNQPMRIPAHFLDEFAANITGTQERG
jgi:acyl-CoA thioester hydrolase